MRRTEPAARAAAPRRGWTTVLAAPLLALLAGAGCTDAPPLPDAVESFKVSFAGGPDLGTAEQPLAFSTGEQTFTVDIEARQGGAPYPFSGHAVLSVRPVGETRPDPLWVELKDGKARDVQVTLTKAYGPVRLVVTEDGYVPAANAAKAACNNGEDDDGDGFVDYPDDRGCYYANDESEGGGSGATGASSTIFFAFPSIHDVQKPILGVTGEESPLKGQRVTVNRGWMLVTRVGTDGMYVTDFSGASWDAASESWEVKTEDLAYDSIFAFNFSTPLNLQEGDCLVQMDGTVDEFFGYTELGKPTWKKGDFAYCAQKAKNAGLTDCPTDNAAAETDAGKRCRQRIEALANTPVDLTKLIVNQEGSDRSIWADPLQAEPYESALVQVSGVEVFTEARRCDVTGNNLVDFTHPDEKDCSNDCGDDTKCVVWETYHRYGQWTVHFKDGVDEEREVSVVSAGGIQSFDPLLASEQAQASGQPKTLGRVVGSLRHLVFGRPQWTIEVRRPADCPDCVNETTP